MSVQITFEPDSDSGLVAPGTYIWEAARRLGVSIPTTCRGRGECDSCAVVIERGADLLSPPTRAEEKMLGERLPSERLACQAILERSGDVSVRLAPLGEGDQQSETRSTLRGLPLKEKVGALIELEAETVTGALNSLRGSYHALIGKFLNLAETTKDAERTTNDAEMKDSAGKNETHADQ